MLCCKLRFNTLISLIDYIDPALYYQLSVKGSSWVIIVVANVPLRQKWQLLNGVKFYMAQLNVEYLN